MSLQNADLADETSEHQQQSQSSFDGSPPQLVVDEMNPSNSEPGVIPNADALSATVNALTNIAMAGEQTNTSICELCSKSFPTKFLHVHMNNVHGIQQQPSGSSNGTAHAVSNTKNALAGGSLKRALPNGNSNVRLKQTPQVQLRVTCQVCKKVRHTDREENVVVICDGAKDMFESFVFPSRNSAISISCGLICAMFTISLSTIYV